MRNLQYVLSTTKFPIVMLCYFYVNLACKYTWRMSSRDLGELSESLSCITQHKIGK